jgi:hypothetical protein
MRYLLFLFGVLVFAACNTAPAARNASQAASPTQAPAAELQKASIDPALQYLLTSAAADFHDHPPGAPPVRVRDVRFGHMMTPEGTAQYMLCGEFQRVKDAGKDEWAHFTTIKTSGYEQYIGEQADSRCQGSKVIWDNEGDLTSSLQSKLDALK